MPKISPVHCAISFFKSRCLASRKTATGFQGRSIHTLGSLMGNFKRLALKKKMQKCTCWLVIDGAVTWREWENHTQIGAANGTQLSAEMAGDVDWTHQQLYGLGRRCISTRIFSTWNLALCSVHCFMVPLRLQGVERHLLVLWSHASDSQVLQDPTVGSSTVDWSIYCKIQGPQIDLCLADRHSLMNVDDCWLWSKKKCEWSISVPPFWKKRRSTAWKRLLYLTFLISFKVLVAKKNELLSIVLLPFI